MSADTDGQPTNQNQSAQAIPDTAPASHISFNPDAADATALHVLTVGDTELTLERSFQIHEETIEETVQWAVDGVVVTEAQTELQRDAQIGPDATALTFEGFVCARHYADPIEEQFEPVQDEWEDESGQ